MSYRALALFPIAFAAAFAGLALALGHDTTAAVLTGQNEIGKAIAAVGCFSAALAFERGEYLRRAWSFSGACFVLLLANDAAAFAVAAKWLPSADASQAVLVVVANASSVVGTVMLARAWTVAGLDHGDSLARKLGPIAVTAALSIAVTGWPLLRDARALAGGDVGAAVSIASDLGDTLCLALVAPVLRTAIAVRGGLLRWPWMLLAASLVLWLVYDLTSGVIEWAHVESAPLLVGSEALRALGAAATFSAGMAQRKAVADIAVSSR